MLERLLTQHNLAKLIIFSIWSLDMGRGSKDRCMSERCCSVEWSARMRCVRKRPTPETPHPGRLWPTILLRYFPTVDLVCHYTTNYCKRTFNRPNFKLKAFSSKWWLPYRYSLTNRYHRLKERKKTNLLWLAFNSEDQDQSV